MQTGVNAELVEAITMLEREKEISRDSLLDAIASALVIAYKNHFNKADNVKVTVDHDTCQYAVYALKTVVEEVKDPILEISVADAAAFAENPSPGEVLEIPVQSKEFGRIATQNARQQIMQKIKEEERTVLYDQFREREKSIITGVVQRSIGRNLSINLGKADAMLPESEQVRGEHFRTTEHIKVYVVEVKNAPRGPKILVSRSHPDLVRCLFEEEVTEVKEGIVEIKSIAREAGSRTKIAVYSSDYDVDPVGACVGLNGVRVGAVVNELCGEKIDIVNWDENPAYFIENALSPAKVISVACDPEEKMAEVVVPDYQLSLAIGKEGQNVRLAARLTGYKIDIKNETQAREAGELFDEYMEEYPEGYEEEYEILPYEEVVKEDALAAAGAEEASEVEGAEAETGLEPEPEA